MEGQFLTEAIINLRQTGSVVPSSRYLVEKMLDKVQWSGKNAVELGAGNGVFTHEILNRMDSGSTLVSFEINANFIEALENISDPRFQLESQSVEQLSQYPSQSTDVVLSSLPIANFKKEFRHQVLAESRRILRPDGVFLQYQYFPWNLNSVREHFGTVSIHFVFRNLPPACFYVGKP